ncbi:MAG: hypothetical protein ACRDRL_27590 [Sciscionella sp.]
MIACPQHRPRPPRRSRSTSSRGGETDTDIDQAIADAKVGWGRKTWDFVEIERHVGIPCPIDADDPTAIATDRQFGRAYAAYGYGCAG